MRALEKGYAIGVIAFFLGGQLIASSPSGGMLRWPFTSYPMYSTARYPSDEVREDRLVGIPCNASASADDLAAGEFGMTEYQTNQLLQQVADTASRFASSPERRASRTANLQQRVLARYGDRYCAVEIWERVYRNDGRRRAGDTPPWQRARTLPLGTRALP